MGDGLSSPRHIQPRPVPHRLFPAVLSRAPDPRHQILPRHTRGVACPLKEIGIGQLGIIGQDAAHRPARPQPAGQSPRVYPLYPQHTCRCQIAREVLIGPEV